MCGRYFFDPAEYGNFLNETGLSETFKGGEIRPTDRAPVLTAEGKVLLSRWGFPLTGQPAKELLHARAETVTEKKLFAPAFASGRLMVPASGFYEWLHRNGKSVRGQKYFFFDPERPRLYMAGLLLPTPEGPSFVIITRPAGPEMADIHDREPLILARAEVPAWLHDASEAARLLAGPAFPLRKTFQGNRL